MLKRIFPTLFAVALTLGLAAGVPAEAHKGQLSKKDGCHKMKAAKERHWHIPGTGDRGGPCVKSDAGATLKVLDPVPEDLTPELEAAKTELAKANRYILGCRSAVRRAVDAPRDWLDQVELDAEGRRALARPCLEP